MEHIKKPELTVPDWRPAAGGGSRVPITLGRALLGFIPHHWPMILVIWMVVTLGLRRGDQRTRQAGVRVVRVAPG